MAGASWAKLGAGCWRNWWNGAGSKRSCPGRWHRLAKRVRRHDPAWELVDQAVAPAAGGECISDLAMLRQQPELFGEVASTSTAWAGAGLHRPVAPGAARHRHRQGADQGLEPGAVSSGVDTGLRRHPGGGGVGEQGAGRSQLQAWLWVSSPAGVRGPERQGTGRSPEAGQRRLQHRPGPTSPCWTRRSLSFPRRRRDGTRTGTWRRSCVRTR